MKKYKLWQIALIIMFFPLSVIFIMLTKKPQKKKAIKTKYYGSNSKLNSLLDDINLNNAHKMGTDLVEADYSFGCCSECAKYRGRVFSISGNDKRFPIKPEDINCSCTGITFYPFFYGISEPTVNDYLNRKVDIIKFSNRPFIDDRTVTEKKNFEEYLKRIEDQKQKELDRVEYQKLLEILPEDVPKSFGAYRRMKNSQSPGFLKLKELAKEHNIEI